MVTDALRRLKGWMAAREITVAGLARMLGVKPPAVSNWLSGHARPKTQYRLAIEKIAGVPFASWLTAEEKERLDSTGTDG